MNRNIAACSVLFLTILTTSCHDGSKQDSKIQYFDLSGFVKKEAIRYCEKNQEVDKVVYLDGKMQKKNVCIYDWDVELNSFIETNINKGSFRGKYAIDSSKEGEMISVKYAALDPQLTIREVLVTFDSKGIPIKMNGTKATRNTLYKSDEKIGITFGKEYWISGKMKIAFLKPDTFAVHAVFTP